MNVTVLSDHVYGNLIIILVISIGIIWFYHVHEGLQFSTVVNEANLGERKLFVTNFRSLVNLLTAICILAVDFKIFPRRFAKAETYGYSVMDIGVGFFVVSNAIVSPEARNKIVLLPWKTQIKRALLSSLPLAILGFARLLSVKSVDYHEHVTEYGVHWNFFFTLASLKIVCSIMLILVRGTNPLIVGVIVATLHQFFLCQGLSEYILNGADGQGGRQGLIDANREGLISLPGYFALYMISIQFGKFIFWKRSNIKEWFLCALHMTVIITLCSVLMHVLNDKIQPVSRRFTNAAYVLFVIGQSCSALLVTLIGEIVVTCLQYMKSNNALKNSQTLMSESEQDKQGKIVQDMTSEKGFISARRNLYENGYITHVKSNSCLLEAISFNSLLFFLLANLLTGLVNLILSTIHTSSVTAVIVLLVYLFLLCSTVSVLHRKKISTKIW